MAPCASGVNNCLAYVRQRLGSVLCWTKSFVKTLPFQIAVLRLGPVPQANMKRLALMASSSGVKQRPAHTERAQAVRACARQVLGRRACLFAYTRMSASLSSSSSRMA